MPRGLSRRNNPPRASTDFFFVDYEESKSQQLATERHKQAFIKSKHYQIKREEDLRNLKSSIDYWSFPRGTLLSNSGVTNQASNNSEQLSQGCASSRYSSQVVLPRSPTVKVLDFFPSLPSSLTSNPDIYLHYYSSHTSKTVWPFAFHDIPVALWQKAYEYPALGQIILSTSASQLTITLRIQNGDTPVVQDAAKDTIRFRLHTIKSLQQTLVPMARAYPETAIVVVGHLLGLEVAEANVAAVEAHMIGLKRLVSMVGGLDMLENVTLATIYICEVMRGFLIPSQPIFHISRAWETRVLHQSTFLAENYETPYTSSLGTRFFDSPWSYEIHPDFKSNLQLLRQIIVYYEYLLRTDSTPDAIANDCFLLLGLRLNKLDDKCSQVGFQETLRLSTIAYCMLRIYSFQGMPSLAIFAERLHQSLVTSFSDLRSRAPDLLFWILFMGGLISQREIESHEWFIARLTGLANELSAISWEDAVHLLEGYYFVSRSKDPDVHWLWQSVLRAREAQPSS